MKISGQIHAPTVLPPALISKVLIDYEAGEEKRFLGALGFEAVVVKSVLRSLCSLTGHLSSVVRREWQNY